MKNSFLLIVFNICLCLISYSQVNLQDSLVAYFPFNGNSLDESGNHHNGIITGGVTLTADRFGNPDKAYSFDGINGQIELENSVGLNLNNGVGLSFNTWYKTDYKMWLIHHHHCGYGNGFGLTIRDSLFWYYFNGLHLLDSMPSDNIWHMVTFIYDYSFMKIYVDGEFSKEIEQTGDYVLNDKPIMLGASSDSLGCPDYSKGILDDVRLYNRVLNEQEIQVLFNEGLTNVDEFVSRQSSACPEGEARRIVSYPNPTGGIINLQFTVYNLQSISLRIYNAQGQEVAVVLEEKLSAGEHTVRWDAQGMPAGIYFYQLTTDDYRLTTSSGKIAKY
jgi:hypothetical protein